MKKYIKWILLILCIVSIIITIIMFINFMNDRNNNPNIEESKVNLLYNKRWYRIGISYYENNELVAKNFQLNDLRFVVFYEEYVEFCNESGLECNKYNYSFDEENSMIFFDSENYLIEKGTYTININEDSFDLSLPYDEVSKVTYHFEIAKG